MAEDKERYRRRVEGAINPESTDHCCHHDHRSPSCGGWSPSNLNIYAVPSVRPLGHHDDED